ncbi:UvrD-helicase domain-containing protein [Neobacillus niacini]|uniref:UvrD-helicase domain-containing protein n=1 Tax=Neobacillus niacini TaxID=86668 RepID=UPI0028569CD6|nr:UvrD-helicase domain-containing protein [Neobacillus niacini]MDR6999676.1 DNA helicase-2/ATP-dependent DNA helicase PcrA [Neobacillus niacini]
MMDQLIEYSYVLYADSYVVKRESELLSSLLEKGVKVLLFTNKQTLLNWTEMELAPFKKAKLFNLMIEDITIDKTITIIDGQWNKEITSIVDDFPRFNVEQYKIEHAPYQENIMVKAGAGTGKTTVMVERVLYLLLKEKIKPAEIVMITFTRDAAQNMYKKLREQLYLRSKASGSMQLLALLEQLNEMSIKTIHSFSKALLKELGSLRGFGLNLQLRSFKTEKKRWIEEELNRYFEAELANKDITIEDMLSPLKFYELVDTLYDFWEKFEQKGFSSYEIIEKVDFGEAPPGNERLNDLIQTVIRKVESRFISEKELLNAVMMNDLTRQIDLIRETHGAKAFQTLSTKISYLFVDEFQDSDDVQIRLIATLQEAFGSTLFVVGDTKQSIYRFRGANHTAFQILKQSLEERQISINDEDYYLNKNYRTTEELLTEMDQFFSWWGEKEYLQYDGENDRLKGMRHGNEEVPLVILNKREDSKENMRTNFMPFIKQHFTNIQELNEAIKPGEEPEKLAVLTRTIEEARMINRWCKEEKLPIKLKVGGGFFLSQAVRNFHSLILALLFPDNGKYLANLLEGPYGQVQKNLLPDLLAAGRYTTGTVEILKGATSFSFEKYHRLLSYQPVLSVLRTIINDRKPYNWIFSRKLDELRAVFAQEYTEERLVKEAKDETRKYEMTVGKLFEMLHQRFSEDFVSLNQIADWLQVQIATNRDEEEVSFEPTSGGLDHVHILTAHRAKGLEYHTVIIPFTERPFTSSFSKIIFDDKKEKAGWSIQKPGYEVRYNNHFMELSSHDETESIKEETRLLYVAMTRAKNQLILIRNMKNDAFHWTWSRLLTQFR